MNLAGYTPINQVRLTNVAYVRLQKRGKRFEIACYRNKAVNWRNKIETSIEEVLQIDTVFTNVSKGMVANGKDLMDAFGTTDQLLVCKEILDKGELQVSEQERGALLESIFRDVASIVADKSINPESGRPYTVSLIQNAMKQIHFSANMTKSAKSQALDVIRKLKEVMPIARASMLIRIVCLQTACESVRLALVKELGFSAPMDFLVAQTYSNSTSGDVDVQAAVGDVEKVDGSSAAATGTGKDDRKDFTSTGTISSEALLHVLRAEGHDESTLPTASGTRSVGLAVVTHCDLRVDPELFRKVEEIVSGCTSGAGRVEVLQMRVAAPATGTMTVSTSVKGDVDLSSSASALGDSSSSGGGGERGACRGAVKGGGGVNMPSGSIKNGKVGFANSDSESDDSVAEIAIGMVKSKSSSKKAKNKKKGKNREAELRREISMYAEDDDDDDPNPIRRSGEAIAVDPNDIVLTEHGSHDIYGGESSEDEGVEGDGGAEERDERASQAETVATTRSALSSTSGMASTDDGGKGATNKKGKKAKRMEKEERKEREVRAQKLKERLASDTVKRSEKTGGGSGAAGSAIVTGSPSIGIADSSYDGVLAVKATDGAFGSGIVPTAAGVVSSGNGTMKSCNTCGGEFEDMTAYRNHFRSEWHRHNLSRKLKNLPIVPSEEAFNSLSLEELGV